MDRNALIVLIDEFQTKTGMADTAIGLSALNDGKFVAELRNGRRCWPETAERIAAFIKDRQRFTTARTADGTVIAYDPATGTSASGLTVDEALAELRRLTAGKVAA